MATELFLARRGVYGPPESGAETVTLDSDGCYWFLYRYFEAANLFPGKGSLIDLYEDAEIEGYQLHRLKTELQSALQVVRLMPERWKVLTGWRGREPQSVATEIWKEIDRSEMVDCIERLLSMIATAESSELVLVGYSD